MKQQQQLVGTVWYGVRRSSMVVKCSQSASQSVSLPLPCLSACLLAPLPRSVIWHGQAGRHAPPVISSVSLLSHNKPPPPQCPPAGRDQSNQTGEGARAGGPPQAFQIRRYVAQMQTGRQQMNGTYYVPRYPRLPFHTERET